MLLGLFVYLSLLILFPICGYGLKYRTTLGKNISIRPFFWIGIIYFTLIIGLRYDVGVDYLLYKEVYQSQLISNREFTAKIGNYVAFEPGFSAITYFFTKYRMHFCFLFLSIALLQSTFLFKFCKTYHSAAGWILFFYITSSTFFDSLNGMRQMTAFYMYLCTIPFILKRKFLPYFLSIIAISLFHKSIFLMLPAYFIVHCEIFSKRKWPTIIVLSSFIGGGILSYFILNVLFPSVGTFLTAFDRISSYTENSDALQLAAREDSLEIASLIYLSIDLIIVYHLKELQTFYRNKININIFFNLFLFGSFLYYFSTTSITLSRINYYFANFRFIMLGFLVYMLTQYCPKNKRTQNILVIAFLIAISLAWFFNAILHGAKNLPYQFI